MERAVIRADASIKIGTGHIMRCLVLAKELKQAGVEVYFISCELPGDLCAYVEQQGYPVHRLSYLPESDSGKHDQIEIWEKDLEQTRSVLRRFEGKILWLIVDHYKLDEKWEAGIRQYVDKIMVIDDLADRRHDCDVLLDQNLYKDPEQRYCVLVPSHCQTLLGPKYALLRPEFKMARERLKIRDGTIKNIFVFYGGTDPTGETFKALEAIRILKKNDLKDVKVDVVVGKGNPKRQEIKSICALIPNATFHCQIDYMADLMSKADLVLGAGGSSTWERCCLALPSIVTVTAKNQLELSENLSSLGVTRNLGWHTDVTIGMIMEALKEMLNPSKVLYMGKKAGMIIEENFLCKKGPLVYHDFLDMFH